ncbi:DiGeorge syndrome critical region protein 14 [Mortierella claussenii]|nr:DiGeorge syndrome critical region protein 14 [Mortierella claussenii]
MASQELTLNHKNSGNSSSSSSSSNGATAASSSLVTATKYRSNVPPPPPQQVLEEDEYVEALSKIIERDFFPDLAKLKRQHTYLEAVKMNDIQRIQAAAKDIAGNDTPLGQRRLRTPARTPRLKSGVPDAPWTPARVDTEATPTWNDDRQTTTADMSAADTPLMDTPSLQNLRKHRTNTALEPSKEVVDTSLSLDQFQSQYTSEDNASFNQIVEKINRQKREKYSWLYEQEDKHRKAIEGSNNPDQKLLRDTGEDDSDASKEPFAASDKNTSLALISSDKRSAVIPTWEYKAKNSLMYYPEGLGTNVALESIRAAPKEIVHRNTGFHGQDLLVVNQAAARKASRIDLLKDDITGSPRVGGFGFVSSTPTPAMSQMGDDPDLMTWGAIEDEPLLIRSGVTDSVPSPFKLPPTPRRELIAQKLTEKATKRIKESSSLRAKVFTSPSMSALSQYHQSLGGSTPTPSFNSPYNAVARTPLGRTPGSSKLRSVANRMASPGPRTRAEMLSPAAQHLLDRARSSKSREADHQLRSSYGNNSPASISGGAGPRLGSACLNRASSNHNHGKIHSKTDAEHPVVAREAVIPKESSTADSLDGFCAICKAPCQYMKVTENLGDLPASIQPLFRSLETMCYDTMDVWKVLVCKCLYRSCFYSSLKYRSVCLSGASRQFHEDNLSGLIEHLRGKTARQQQILMKARTELVNLKSLKSEIRQLHAENERLKTELRQRDHFKGPEVTGSHSIHDDKDKRHKNGRGHGSPQESAEPPITTDGNFQEMSVSASKHRPRLSHPDPCIAQEVRYKWDAVRRILTFACPQNSTAASTSIPGIERIDWFTQTSPPSTFKHPDPEHFPQRGSYPLKPP